MFLILNRQENLDPVLEGLMKVGVSGATILDSKGMGQEILNCESPVVGGLRQLIYEQCRPYNKTVIAVIESEEAVERTITEVEKTTGDLSQPGTGVLFVLPLYRVKGVRKGKAKEINEG